MTVETWPNEEAAKYAADAEYELRAAVQFDALAVDAIYIPGEPNYGLIYLYYSTMANVARDAARTARARTARASADLGGSQ